MTSQLKFRHVVVAIVAMIAGFGPTLVAEGQVNARRSRVIQTTTSKPTQFGFAHERSVTRSYVPQHQRANARQVVHREVVMQDSPPMMDGTESIVGMDSVVGVTAGCESCGTEVVCGADWTGYCDNCDSCGTGGCGGCNSCNSCGVNGCMIPCPQISLSNMEFFGGVQGFKGQPNRGRDGSFGFHFGFNWGFDLPCLTQNFISAQFGIGTVQSNFYESDLSTTNRSQTFATFGLFRRVDYGLQAGAVVDVLNDRWYTEMTLSQLRGQLSWLYQGGNEIGFWFASGLQDDVQPVTFANNPPANGIDNWRALNTYRFFYTHQLDQCGLGGTSVQPFLGGTGNGDFLLGTDFWVPLAQNWALSADWVYVVPKTTTGTLGAEDEAWNIGMTLTYYPQGLGRYLGRYNRPMFDVANNGTFLIDR